ncbi:MULTISPECIES: carboxylate-amine ligase [Cyanophyceae]|uniref:carboxylate-amine ligase n=1 Tax=Cyanophyceae TaxID=3028117 RepID=UPI00232D520A|nr:MULTISPECIES: YbdK family carboxylate-amine ligase [Cyanophyceae]MDB9357184.1 YbdK family carboxylate-amine ligase [Nodularia spumigena CS-587/03]MDB9304886.1 YbdK family carboxylate-amine ligase [Nodularia spumigena CS-591/12]MDB9316081.1 YbdK family carboxylate-amine ligase [Nodularia spumigena CS-590/01A]MDB9322498.1 YbdK family carboxylate-amine ligase [Nodularia spumigena CS-591/07A]MDB9327443.1 YbdK family carboxylate-amine ligase [Nodularia spumigena CS-590/02]
MTGIEFKSSPEFSLGMEIELQLLNPHTLELVDGILPLLAQDADNSYLQPEFKQASVEISSQVCRNIHELEASILANLCYLKAKCQNLGMNICAAGTHAFCNHFTPVTPIPRYLAQHTASGYIADIMTTFALQIHVGMPSGDAAVDIMGKLKPYLPILLALSASSPFWWGHDTGFASYRRCFLSSFRTYGSPPSFPTWQDFSDFFITAQHAGMFEIIRDIHWDLRPQPNLGTLEIRVMDAQPTVKESIMLAAFVHSLVLYLHNYPQGTQTGFLLSPLPSWMEKENIFRASRWGLDANYIEDQEGNSRPMRSIVKDILDAIGMTADTLGERPYLDLLEQRLDTGASYIRQRRVFESTGSLKAVVASLVKELAEELTISPYYLAYIPK